MGLPDIPWIHDEPGEPDEHGLDITGEWVLRVEKAYFKPCGERLRNDSSVVCMAAPGHEHPHICCNVFDDYWDSRRVVNVSRKFSMAGIK